MLIYAEKECHKIANFFLEKRSLKMKKIKQIVIFSYAWCYKGEPH